MSGYRRILTGEPVPQRAQQAQQVDLFGQAGPEAPSGQPASPPAPALQAPALQAPQSQAKPGTITDPRPDLAEDTAYWTQVFVLALALDVKAKRDKALFGALHGMRCAGTRLVRSDKTGKLVFRPLVGPGGWGSEAEYREAAGRYLRPYDRDMKELLRQLNRGNVSAETRENCPWGEIDGP